jgi:hypothetical protein
VSLQYRILPVALVGLIHDLQILVESYFVQLAQKIIPRRIVVDIPHSFPELRGGAADAVGCPGQYDSLAGQGNISLMLSRW